MALFEGSCNGKAIDPEIGFDEKSNCYVVRWQMEVTEGKHAGKRASYKGKLDKQNIKYTKRDMVAIGWKGVKAVETFAADVKAADLTVPFTAEIASWEDPKSGKLKQWTTARSFGFAAAPLAPVPQDKIDAVNGWFDEAGDVGSPPNGSSGGSAEEPLPF